MIATVPENVVAELREMRVKLKQTPVEREVWEPMLARVQEMRKQYGHDAVFEAVMAIVEDKV